MISKIEIMFSVEKCHEQMQYSMFFIVFLYQTDIHGVNWFFSAASRRFRTGQPTAKQYFSIVEAGLLVHVLMLLRNVVYVKFLTQFGRHFYGLTDKTHTSSNLRATDKKTLIYTIDSSKS
jgi:hypothetical protein